MADQSVDSLSEVTMIRTSLAIIGALLTAYIGYEATQCARAYVANRL